MSSRRCRIYAVWIVASLMLACSKGAPLQSPVPTENPSAHVPMVIKITPPSDFTGTIEATAEWVIASHACAPKDPVSGSYREEPAHRPATIRRDGSSYVLSAFTDQFKTDSCRWTFTGISFHLYQDGHLVGIGGANNDTLKESGGRLQIICDPDPSVPDCVYAEAAKRTFLKSWPQRKVFSFTIEGV